MDTIGNALSSIKNAAMAGRPFAEVYYSKVLEEILKVIKEAGFFDGIKVFKPEGRTIKKIHVDLAFEDGTPKVSDIKRISKPGRRTYKTALEIKKVMGGYGLAVVSTSRGIMSGHTAKKKKLGGEVVCEVY
ncbi:MAG: 30S ribosomal protein S8 [Patescibacteria group bacterium]